VDTIPVEPFIDHPVMMTLPCAAYGIMMRLAHHFWASECAPLPVTDSELRSIARAHPPTWRKYGKKTMEIWAEIEPALVKYYQHRLLRREILREAGAKGLGLRALHAARKADTAANGLYRPRKQAGGSDAAATVPAGRTRRSD
jgi:hypothetical protein